MTVPMNAIFLREAIRLSIEKMAENEGGPFGAVIVRDGKIIERGWNRVTSTNDPTAHTEILAIRDACSRLKTYSLQGSEIFSTCEPCLMCLHNFLVCGEKHLNYLVREYVSYYNENRAHSSRDYLPPTCTDPPPENETINLNKVLRHERLGGLIKWYERAA